MAASPTGQRGPGTDGCAALRVSVTSLCDGARQAHAAYATSAEVTRELRRKLVAAEHKQADADAAVDHRKRADEKATARTGYEEALELAHDDGARAEAIAEWARALDRINRAGRLAKRDLAKARAEVARITQLLHDAERAEQRERITAESAEAACLDARVKLAACEERVERGLPAHAEALASPTAPAGLAAPAGPAGLAAAGRAGLAPPGGAGLAPAGGAGLAPVGGAAPGGHAGSMAEDAAPEPLIIEVLLTGDHRTLDLAATRIAEHTGLQPAESLLQLQELVDDIVAAASEDGFLVFDQRHPFWARLTFDESRDVMAALARLGFIFEPAQGWHAGRAPAPSDLSMALAYAGQDARQMRDLPGADELRELPRSIFVDARAFLVARAPDLTLEHVVGVLGRRSERLEPLWNEWGQIRPLLLSQRRTLDGS